MEIILPVTLLVLGIIAVIIEVFIPAAGILGIFGGGCIVGSVVLAYVKIGTLAGNIFLGISIVVTPIVFTFAFKIFPKTFFGKRIILHDELSRKNGYESHDSKIYDGLLKKEGITLTDCKPVGTAMIDNKKYNVTTNGEYINKGEKIKIIKIIGSRIVISNL